MRRLLLLLFVPQFLDSDANHYENEESVYMAVAEDDGDDAIYATFTALNYKRRESEQIRRPAPPLPVTSKPHFVNGGDTSHSFKKATSDTS